MRADPEPTLPRPASASASAREVIEALAASASITRPLPGARGPEGTAGGFGEALEAADAAPRAREAHAHPPADPFEDGVRDTALDEAPDPFHAAGDATSHQAAHTTLDEALRDVPDGAALAAASVLPASVLSRAGHPASRDGTAPDNPGADSPSQPADRRRSDRRKAGLWAPPAVLADVFDGALKQPQPRRPVRPTGRYWIALFTFAIIALPALFHIGLVARATLDLAAFKQRSAVVQGYVTGLDGTQRGQGRRAYAVTYVYLPDVSGSGLKGYRNIGYVSEENYHRLSLHQRVPVRYNPQDPARAALEDELPIEMRGGLLGLALPGFLALFFGTKLLLLARDYRLQRELLTRGHPAHARVRLSPLFGHGEAQHVAAHIDYAFEDPAGEFFTGTLRAVPLAQAKVAKEHATALYDPKDPGKHGLYPLELVQVGEAKVKTGEA